MSKMEQGFEGQATLAELNRFRSLFGEQGRHLLHYMQRIDDDAVYAAIPIDTEVNFLGTRVNKITIGGLIRHLILAETHWFEAALNAKDGDAMPFPANAALLEGVKDGAELSRAFAESWERAQPLLDRYTPEVLNKTLSFAGRRYTVMGMLWTILGHRAYHLGQVDQLMRQLGIEPPEYMEWPDTARVLG